jgi:carboxyl-terminal processing protease
MRAHRLLIVSFLGAILALSACSKSSPQSSPTTSTTPAPAANAVAVTPGATTIPPTSVAPSAAAATTLPATPAALSPSRIETVKLVYDILRERYYKPLKSDALLAEAWRGASGAAGVSLATPRFTGNSVTDWQTFAGAYAQLFSRSGAQTGTELAFAAARAMIDSLHDDHTYFLDPQAYQRRKAESAGGDSYVGIGVSFAQNAPFTIAAVIPGSPAEKAGLRPGDVITAIDGTATATLSPQEGGSRLRGQEGQPVRLSIRHADGSSADVTLVRARIVNPAIRWRVLPDGIGYIQLASFADAYARFSDGRNIAETLDLALQTFEQTGVKGWIVDLRGNPGGSEQTLSEFAGRFLASGIVLDAVDRDGHETRSPVDGHLFPVQRPLAVLVDNESGSAAELFAATMQEYGRARIVGTRTAGAVNGALETALPDGAAIQYTVVEARTGKNRRPLDGSGVTPDDIVRGTPADILGGETDPQYLAAKSWVLQQAARQPLLPAATPMPARTLSADALRSLLAPLAAQPADVPPGPARDRFGDLVLTHPNELCIGIADDCPDPDALDATALRRGWQGSYEEFFGDGAPAPVTVEFDLYADAAGAQDALRTNDFPYGLRAVPAPARLGDETVAYTGYDAAAGVDQIAWRRGRLVVIVQVTANPGESALPTALAIAQRLDARLASRPLP